MRLLVGVSPRMRGSSLIFTSLPISTATMWMLSRNHATLALCVAIATRSTCPVCRYSDTQGKCCVLFYTNYGIFIAFGQMACQLDANRFGSSQGPSGLFEAIGLFQPWTTGGRQKHKQSGTIYTVPIGTMWLFLCLLSFKSYSYFILKNRFYNTSMFFQTEPVETKAELEEMVDGE